MRLPAAGTVKNGFSQDHQAVDIANTLNTAILAPHPGTISIAGPLGDCGLAVQIGNTTDGSRLCHLNTIAVRIGQTVREGEQVGAMGYSGKTIPAGPAGTHVHWVLWLQGRRVDGRLHLTVNGGSAQMPEKVNLGIARILGFYVLGRDGKGGRPHALRGEADGDLTKHHVGQELTNNYIQSLYTSPEGQAALSRADAPTEFEELDFPTFRRRG